MYDVLYIYIHIIYTVYMSIFVVWKYVNILAPFVQSSIGCSFCRRRSSSSHGGRRRAGVCDGWVGNHKNIRWFEETNYQQLFVVIWLVVWLP